MLIRLLLIMVTFVSSDWAFADQSKHSNHQSKHSNHQVTTDKCETIAIKCAPKVSSVASDDGRIWSVWTIGQHLYLNYSDDLGLNYSAPKRVNQTPEKISVRGENRPKIALDGAGNVYLSWVTPLSKRFTANVRFSYWSAANKSFSAPVTVNDDGLMTGHSFNELVVTKQGEVFIAWLDGRAKVAAAKKGIELRNSELYLANANLLEGRSQFDNTRLAQGTCVCCRLAMDLDDRQLPILMWRHVFGDNYRDHGYVTMRDTKHANEMKRVSFENWQVDGCPHQGPTMVKDNNIAGRVHMSWFNNAPNASGLFYSYSDDNGQTMAKVNHYAGQENTAEHPYLSQSRQGKIQLIWREFDGDAYRIKYIHSDNGQQWSDAITLTQSKNKVDYPYILQHPSGSYLHWHQVGQPLKLIKL